MSASAADVARLRRMTNELTTTTYSDATMALYLEAWPLTDANGINQGDSDSWVEAYDLHAAAGDIWDEKAATVQSKHDFSADGANFSANQMFDNAMRQAKHHRALQKAKVKVIIPAHQTPGTFFPMYANPIYDEDEPLEQDDFI